MKCFKPYKTLGTGFYITIQSLHCRIGISPKDVGRNRAYSTMMIHKV